MDKYTVWDSIMRELTTKQRKYKDRYYVSNEKDVNFSVVSRHWTEMKYAHTNVITRSGVVSRMCPYTINRRNRLQKLNNILNL